VAGVPPTGEQFVIRNGDQTAVVTQVGATLREYRSGSRDVVDGFAVDQRSTGGHGQVLAPWPNRIGDGRYTFGGHTCQAALDEPARQNAIHGLVRWLDWTLVELEPELVILGCHVRPQPGYAWPLDLRVGYRLGAGGLEVTTDVVNAGHEIAPFGLGFHPYVTAGVPVDGAILTVPARRSLEADDRALPTGMVDVSGTGFDFRSGRLIGDLRLDHAYADLVRGADGRAVAVLSAGDAGPGAAVWVDGSFEYLMVYTGDTLDEPARRRRAVAIEPMTCPPDALRTGIDLVLLEPGAQWRGSWGIEPR
jgi:aldose 1-epimerase